MTSKKSTKLTGAEQVAAYMNTLEHPMIKEIELVRGIILGANCMISEHIKWNAPSFQYNDVDRITFNFHGKGYIQLIFHCGAKVRDNIEKRLIEDTSGLLNWVTNDRAIMKFTDMEDVEDNKERLEEVIKKWIAIVI